MTKTLEIIKNLLDDFKPSITHAGERAIDMQKVDNLIAQVSSEDRKHFIRKAIDNTIYVPWDTFCIALKKSFDEFRAQMNPNTTYYLLLNNTICSEWLCISLVSPLPPNIKLIFSSFDIEDFAKVTSMQIIIIDDCMYSGNSMLYNVDEFTADFASSIKQKQRELSATINIHFHLIIPYVSMYARSSVEVYFSKQFGISGISFYYNCKAPSILDFITEWDEGKVIDMYREFGNESDPILLYFDHCIGGEFSSFPGLYLKGLNPETSKENGLLISHHPSTEYKEALRSKIRDLLESAKNP